MPVPPPASAGAPGLYSPPMPHAELTLPGHASSVPAARRFVETLLASWGHPETGWSAALCISELASNCALHARTDFSVRLLLEQDRVRLEVTDGSPRVPLQRAYAADATTGRGLRLLEDYASSWGCEPTADGKTVWVLLDLAADEGAGDLADDDLSIEALLAAFDDDEGAPRATARWTERAAA